MEPGREVDELKAAPAPAREGEVSALARGLGLLRAVADADLPPGNRELAELTGIPKATVSRLAATLVGAGYLRQDEASEHYTLGPTLLGLGNAYLRNFDFRQQARPHLARLAEAAGANVHLAVRDGLDVLLIDTLRPRSALVLSQMDVGSRMAIATSAAGRAYLASTTQQERDGLLQELGAASSNKRALQARLALALAEYAKLGFCTSFGEWHPDIHAIGFSLRGPRDELYAVSCGGPAYLLPKKLMLERIGPRVAETRRAIAQEMGAS